LNAPSHIVVFRFSALGDVAMTVPVVKLLLAQHPELTITYVSNSFVQPLFSGIDRLNFFAADLKGRHKGLIGLWRLAKEIRREKKIDAVADLHNVLRTNILRGLFFPHVKKVSVIDKGRKEKREITRIDNKRLRPLKSTFQRYADVFNKLGYSIDLPVPLSSPDSRFPIPDSRFPIPDPRFPIPDSRFPISDSRFPISDSRLRIGIAPFAKHLQKQYPPDKMKEVIRLLDAENDKEILLFGGREDANDLELWEKEFKNVKNLAGKLPFEEELKIISTLHVMVSMDSANMHLASLFDVPVISVWGGTHPFAGFYGWKQEPGNAVQVDLYCRPCSVFGNKPCYRGDLACLHSILPVAIYDRISKQLYNTH
jgi:ADP-heptose:LPS heptosyltransferase